MVFTIARVRERAVACPPATRPGENFDELKAFPTNVEHSHGRPLSLNARTDH